LVALAADRSLARAAGNLLDIPAVAIAAGLHQPANPVPGRLRSTSTYPRTLQRAGNPTLSGGPSRGIYPPDRPLDQGLTEIRHDRDSRRPAVRRDPRRYARR
jgi:hypothetical protein